MNNLYDQQSGVIELTTNDFKITKKKITMHNKEFNKKNSNTKITTHSASLEIPKLNLTP